MHDISDNIYISGMTNSLESYSIDRYLHHELAIACEATLNDIKLAVYNILLSHGFRLQLSGTDYLASLITRYIVKSDFNCKKAISDIARVAGVDDKLVVGCINGSITRSSKFIPTACKTLRIAIPADRVGINDVVAIVGALYKIYFNYTVDIEYFEEDEIPAINFSEALLDHGKK